MITEYQRIQPYIDFGFGYDTITLSVGEDATVWVNTLYNESDDYSLWLISEDADITKVSDYEYTLNYDTPGEYSVQFRVEFKKSEFIYSNTLTVTVA